MLKYLFQLNYPHNYGRRRNLHTLANVTIHYKDNYELNIILSLIYSENYQISNHIFIQLKGGRGDS